MHIRCIHSIHYLLGQNFMKNKWRVRAQTLRRIAWVLSRENVYRGSKSLSGERGASSHFTRTLLLFLLWHTLTTISLLQSPSGFARAADLFASPYHTLLPRQRPPLPPSSASTPSVLQKEDSQLLIERNF